jgi:hypothetical protein
VALALENSDSVTDHLLNIDQMSGEQFESCLTTMAERNGYEVERTPRFGDYGADLILSTESVRIAVQAKRWSQLVGLGAVQEIAAAKTHYHCHEAAVITNHFFSKQAQTLGQSTGVLLWDRDELRQQLKAADMLDLSRPSVAPLCWKCGIKMLVRSGKYGSFFGCQNYPKCHCVAPRTADEPVWLIGPEPARSVQPGSLLSPDKLHWWDGTMWHSTAEEVPPDTKRSEDGYYWWDGENWRLVPEGTRL